MKLDEIERVLAESTAEEWYVLPEGGRDVSFLYAWDQAPGGTWEPRSHHSLAVWRPNVGLSLAWGLYVEDASGHPSGAAAHLQGLLQRDAAAVWADILWQGALVDRRMLYVVDSGRAYLPAPEAELNHRGWEGSTVTHYTVRQDDVAFAQLINDLSYGAEDLPMSLYLDKTGWQVLPG